MIRGVDVHTWECMGGQSRGEKENGWADNRAGGGDKKTCVCVLGGGMNRDAVR